MRRPWSQACSVSVNAVMSQLERDPGEFKVDPWVIERATLVADQRERIVAAAHLLRYAADVAPRSLTRVALTKS